MLKVTAPFCSPVENSVSIPGRVPDLHHHQLLRSTLESVESSIISYEVIL